LLRERHKKGSGNGNPAMGSRGRAPSEVWWLCPQKPDITIKNNSTTAVVDTGGSGAATQLAVCGSTSTLKSTSFSCAGNSASMGR